MIHASKFTNKTKNISHIHFDVLGNKEIINRSCFDKRKQGIETSELWSNSLPKDNGLLDLRHGSTFADYNCKTCGLKYKYCTSHESHIKLARPVYNIGYFDYIVLILNCFCTKCSHLLLENKTNEIIKNIEQKKGKQKIIEFKKYIKNIKFCPYCNTAVEPVKSDIQKKKGTIGIKKEIKIENSKNKKFYENLTATDVFNILKNIRTNDAILLGLNFRPEDLMHYYFPIPGVHMRPSIRGDFTTQTTTEDPLTIKLVEVFKANEKVIQNIENPDKSVKLKEQYVSNNIDLLQFNIATYFNNDSLNKPHTEHKTGLTKSLTSILKGKEGRFRGSLMRKRVFHSARTVISSDPTISINQLRMPLYVAMILTFPEIVTNENMEFLKKCVINGPYKYIGANFVRKGNKLIDLRINNLAVQLNIGDIVERHLMEGDPIIFNRQPTLHKHGILCLYVRVCMDPLINTFGLNPSVCRGFGADFDGDEMNCHTPQSIQTRIEIESIADAKYQFMSPTQSTPIIQCIQDCLVGAYNLTYFGKDIDSSVAMDIYSSTNINNFDLLEKNKKYTGNEIYSLIIPNKINLSRKSIQIKKGQIIKGCITKDSLGDKNGNLIHTIFDECKATTTKNFLNNTNTLAINYNFANGMTIGIDDYLITKEQEENIYKFINEKITEVLCEITEYENNPSLLNNNLFEEIIKTKLDSVRDKMASYVYDLLSPNNNVKILIDSGGAGTTINLSQMCACLCQQIYEEKRMPKTYNNRCAPYFFQNDDRPESRGFIKNSFVKGLTLYEFIAHAITSREGVIDTAVKTATTGYLQRKLIKATEDFMVKYDGTVRNSTNKVYQFTYGDSGADSIHKFSYEIAFLSMNNQDLKNKMTFYENTNIKFDNDAFYNKIKNYRDELRIYRLKSFMDFSIFKSTVSIPINLSAILMSSMEMNFKDEIIDPNYVLEQIKFILSNENTNILSLSKNDKINENSFKREDDRLIKFMFKCCLYDCLNPKKLYDLKITKLQLDYIVKIIIKKFNKSQIESGEMVGTIASQGLGEPATQMTLNTFHTSGIGGAKSVAVGIPRLIEIMTASKHTKNPQMEVYFKEQDKNKVNKIVSYIKYTTIEHLKNNISIYYEDEINDKDSFMNLDKATHIFSPSKQTTTSCLNKIDGLNWLIRIEFNKEKMYLKETTLLDIKTKIATVWEKRFQNKNYDKKIFEKIIQMAICSNTENDNIPIIHLRFNTDNACINDLINFKNEFIDSFKIKGLTDITDFYGDGIGEMKTITFDKDGNIGNKNEFVLYTKGINIEELRNLVGIDLNKSCFNDIVKTYEVFGIESARMLIIKEIQNVYEKKGVGLNYQHIELIADAMCSSGILTSLDRHGLNKIIDNGVLSRATFEKPVEQVLTAGIFGEKDNINSVSSSIAVGQCIKGGTGAMKIAVDTNFILHSEYTGDENINLQKDYFEEITESKNIVEEDENVFIPDF